MTLADKLTDEMRKEGLEPTPGQLHTCNMLEIDGKAEEKPMIEFRCTKCRRLLAKVDGGKVEIKCPHCRTMNMNVPVFAEEYEKKNKMEAALALRKIITLKDFEKILEEVAPQIKADTDKVMNQESTTAKLFK